MIRRFAILAVLIVAAGLSACGDADTVTVTAGQTGGTGGEGAGSRTVVIHAQNGAFDSHTIYEHAAPGVVTITSFFGGGNTPDLFGGGGGGAGQGSGFVISDQGEILTNAHVVTDAATTGAQTAPLHAAKEVYVQFADRNQVAADIVGFDPFADVALLKVDPDGLDLHALPLGSETDVDVGDGVAAIGSPFGKEQSLSVGVVSATDRAIDSLTDFQIEGAIQTDASINPGNSGGPLLDAAGEVVGINQQIQTASGGNEGVGFAVPIDLAQRSVDQLRDGGDVSYAYAGITTQPLYPQLADRLGLDADTGAIISKIEPSSPAEDAGLHGSDDTIKFQGQSVDVGGDIIVAVDGHPVEVNDDLPRIISLLEPGDKVTLDIIRDGDQDQVDLTLGERPVSSTSG